MLRFEIIIFMEDSTSHHDDLLKTLSSYRVVECYRLVVVCLATQVLKWSDVVADNCCSNDMMLYVVKWGLNYSFAQPIGNNSTVGLAELGIKPKWSLPKRTIEMYWYDIFWRGENCCLSFTLWLSGSNFVQSFDRSEPWIIFCYSHPDA